MTRSRPASTWAALERACAARDGAPFLSFEGTALTFGALRARALAFAAALAARGVGPGERVALFLPNGPSYVAAFLGAHARRAAVVPLNTQYRAGELAHLVSDSAAALAVADPSAAKAAGLAPLLQVLDPAEAEGTEGVAAATADAITDGGPLADDLALVAYTSGTTGRSKGAMLTHGNLTANAAAVVAAWRWTAADRLLLTLSLFHVHGLCVGVVGSLVSGGSIDLHRRFEAGDVLEALGAVPRPTMFFGVPTMYARLLDEARGRGVALPRLRLWVSGSAPLSPETFRRFEEAAGQRILERYGMTETGMNLTNPYDGERRAGSVGTPFPGQEARIVDRTTRAPLPDGEVGEVEVRGPNVFRGYWGRPDATADAFDPDGWFRTGDLGWRSADGTYTLTGRAHDLIISGGFNVYPREVEDVLRGHPAVEDAAVVGLPDADLGECVAAAVVLRDPSTADVARTALETDLVALCRASLAPYKKPRRVVFVGELPRNAMGKVRKDAVRALLEASGSPG